MIYRNLADAIDAAEYLEAHARDLDKRAEALRASAARLRQQAAELSAVCGSGN